MDTALVEEEINSYVYSFNSRIVRWLGVIQVVIGVLCMIVNIVALDPCCRHYFNLGYGIWGGIYFVIVGWTAMITGKHKLRYLVKCLLVVSVLCVILVIPAMVVIESLAVHYYIQYDPADVSEEVVQRLGNHTVDELRTHGAMLGLTGVEMCITICCAIICSIALHQRQFQQSRSAVTGEVNIASEEINTESTNASSGTQGTSLPTSDSVEVNPTDTTRPQIDPMDFP